MKFTLKTPCKKCPFRTDIDPYLPPDRVEEILDSITDGQGTFSCHETTEFDDDGEAVFCSPREQHCAGALILLEKLEQPNQLMRIFERLGSYDMRALDMNAPVFDTPEDMIDSAEQAA